MTKTLYVTDLDGTLLNPQQRVSDKSADIINGLIGRGMLFAYATARSVHTASKVAGNIRFATPVIAHNGTFINDNATEEIIGANYFSAEEAGRIIAQLDRLDVSHIVYSIMEGRERFSFVDPKVSPQLRKFLDLRLNDVRRRAVQSRAELYRGDIYYFNCIDDPVKLAPLYEMFRGEFNCVYQPEVYSGDMWLEMMPKTASKASAVMQLKRMTGADRVVVFGDGMNDMPMFEVADECYAVANAVEELKKAATGVIGANTEDGVALWLAENFVG